MHQNIALVGSLASLGLICAIYFCNVLSRPGSWMRAELVTMAMLAWLVGFFVMGVSSLVLELAPLAQGEFKLDALMSTGIDLVSIGAIAATMLLFGATARSSRHEAQTPNNVTPLTPRPVAPIAPRQTMRKAA